MLIFLIVLVVLACIAQRLIGRRALRDISCTLSTDRYLVDPEESFALTVTLDNRSRLPVFYLRTKLNVPMEMEFAGEKRGRIFTSLHMSEYTFACYLLPRQRLEHRVELKIPKRGMYRFEGITLAAGDFFGLDEQVENRYGGIGVVVLPRRVEGVSLPVLTGGTQGERSVNRWIHEDPVLSVGFREYTGREPQKAIAWKRSLQSRQLMVRQYDHTAEERCAILLSTMGGTEARLERCFSLTRTLCEALERRVIPFSVLTNGELSGEIGPWSVLESGLGSPHLNRLLEGLGRATLNCRFGLERLIQMAMGSGQAASCYVLIAPHDTAELRMLAGRLSARAGVPVHILSGEVAE